MEVAECTGCKSEADDRYPRQSGYQSEGPCPLSFCQETPVLGATGQGWAGLGERIGPLQGTLSLLGGVWLGSCWGQQLVSVPGAQRLCVS